LKVVDGCGVLSLEEQYPPDLIHDNAVARVFRSSNARLFKSFIVSPQALERGAKEKMSLRQIRIDLQGLAQDLLGFFHVALLNLRSRDIHPAISILRLHLRNFQEGRFRSLQVSLKQQTYTVVVPTLTH